MKSFLFFIFILASGYWCYENYGQNVPVRTTLAHVDGRSMDVVILSRGKTQVDIQRQSDGRRFSFGIRDLSLISKCKVYWYFREGGGSANTRATAAGALGDLHLSGIREQMEEVTEDISLATYRLNAVATNAQRRTLQHEINALELKMNQLKYKQADYSSRR